MPLVVFGVHQKISGHYTRVMIRFLRIWLAEQRIIPVRLPMRRTLRGEYTSSEEDVATDEIEDPDLRGKGKTTRSV